jgi:hypothetical protein
VYALFKNPRRSIIDTHTDTRTHHNMAFTKTRVRNFNQKYKMKGTFSFIFVKSTSTRYHYNNSIKLFYQFHLLHCMMNLFVCHNSYVQCNYGVRYYIYYVYDFLNHIAREEEKNWPWHCFALYTSIIVLYI